MKLIAEAGLWTTEHPVAPPPAVAVLEVAGAVLAWTVDDAASAVQVTFTDVTAADWLWRVTGVDGHVAVVGAIQGLAADPATTVDVTDVELAPDVLVPLRRLALGHWLRRWWPASTRDGIADLETALLDAEIAVLTADAQDFFAEDSFDSDVAGLLAPHRAALTGHLRAGDPRVLELVRSCAELAEWSELIEPVDHSLVVRRRDDYALAAGADGMLRSGVIGSGTASIAWSAVPAGMFDAAEDTVAWSIRPGGSGPGGSGPVVATVQAAVSGPAAGVSVRLRSGDVVAEGALDERGSATLPLDMPESAAWNHDWTTTAVTVGAGATVETREIRERIRSFARSRLAAPADDAFLAEVLAAESDY